MNRLGLVLLLATAALAGPPAVIKETADQITRALGDSNFIAFRSGLARAQNLRDRYGDKVFDHVIKAIGAAVKHEDKQIAKAAIDALGKFKNRGSGRFLVHYLKAPQTVYLEHVPRFEAAIAAAGSIHDNDSLPFIEKLLVHPQTRIAVAAAGALAPYRTLDRKPRLALIKRLAVRLEKHEKAHEGADTKQKKLHFGLVRAALRDTLRLMTHRKRLETAADVRKWLKEETSS